MHQFQLALIGTVYSTVFDYKDFERKGGKLVLSSPLAFD